jgi:hypothetical protein
MSLCPVCGNALCDHTPEERGQTQEEVARDLSEEELAVWQEHPTQRYSQEKVDVARNHAHDKTGQ